MALRTAAEIDKEWNSSPRWKGVKRGYTAEDVVRLRGTVAIEYSLARLGAEKLWQHMHSMPFVNALGALTGNQAMQQVKAGLKAIYLSGWQVAGDANVAGEMYPDQSLYPANSVPEVVRKINNTLLRADQVHHAEGNDSIDWLQPIVADAEAGFGGVLNAFELMKGMIDAGAAGVHFEDQLSSAKKCGHMGGKVLVPTAEAVNKLIAARLAADVCDVPTVLVARTDAESANLLTADVDERDRPFIDTAKGRTSEGFFFVKAGLDQAIARGLAYAPYADLIWCETGKPDLAEAKHFAEGDARQVPGQDAGLQLLAVVQLEEEARRRDDREVPARAGRDGLQVPVHHAGRLPRAELLDVHAGARLQGSADDGLRRTAGGGVRRRVPGLHRDQAPARSRRRLLRRRHADRHGRAVVGDGDEGLDGRGTVRAALRRTNPHSSSRQRRIHVLSGTL
jgi:isocitrate lyase